MILVTGFSSWDESPVNPAELLVRRMHGRRAGQVPIIGEVIPVSYERGPAQTIQLARRHSANLVVGIGVALTRSEVFVERIGRPKTDPKRTDIDGQMPTTLLPGPDEVSTSLDAEAFARALHAPTSDKAGVFVCNAWIYRVVPALPDIGVGFIHIPPGGMDPDRLLQGLVALTA